jgi:hypothetical protein
MNFLLDKQRGQLLLVRESVGELTDYLTRLDEADFELPGPGWRTAIEIDDCVTNIRGRVRTLGRLIADGQRA